MLLVRSLSAGALILACWSCAQGPEATAPAADTTTKTQNAPPLAPKKVAPQMLDVDSVKVGATIMLGPDGQLYPTARSARDDRRAPLSNQRVRRRYCGRSQPRIFKVVAVEDRVVEVEPTAVSGVCFDSGILAHFQMRAFARKADLMAVSKRGLVKSLGDGAAYSVAAGFPLASKDGRSGPFTLAVLDGALPVPDDAVSPIVPATVQKRAELPAAGTRAECRSFLSEDRPADAGSDLFSPSGGRLHRSQQCHVAWEKVVSVNGTKIPAEHLLDVSDLTELHRRGKDVLVTHAGKCVAVRAKAAPSALRAGQGGGCGSSLERYVVAAGSKVYWPKGVLAGKVTKSLMLNRLSNQKLEVCFFLHDLNHEVCFEKKHVTACRLFDCKR